MLLSTAIDELILATHAAGRSQRTADGYRRHLSYLLAFLGDLGVDLVGASDLRRYAADLQARQERFTRHPTATPRAGGLARDSVISYLRAVKRLFNWLAGEGIIGANPAHGLKLPPAGERNPKAYDLNDFVRLLAATAGESASQRRDRALLLFLADTGCRVGGLSGLRCEDVDLAQRTARLCEKGRRRRVVPFSATTAEALQAWLKVRPASDEPWLFVTLGPRVRQQRLSEDAVGEVLRRLKRRAGVSGRVNPHSFRHGFAREWLRARGDLATLAQMLGHADPGITLRYYARFQPDELHDFHSRYSPVVRLYGDEAEE
ncbi:MAG: tyrosine-type recombinase/integrase [Caldilinea sp.]|nr:tyrosine-type recombinase/integrase [Caldilinea sp.]